MFPLLSIAGIVLCGGESRRMGRDKATLPFGSGTMLEHVVRRLAEAARPIVVVAAEGQVLPDLPRDVRIVRDPVAGQGPWLGIAAGLRALEGQADAAYVTACDAPFLEPAWVRRLTELLGENQIAVPWIDDHYQPLAALYRLDTAMLIEELLTQRLPPLSLFDKMRARIVTADELRDIDPTFATLRNINSPDDYRQAFS